MIFKKSKVRKRMDLRNKIEVKRARLVYLTNFMMDKSRVPQGYVDECADLTEYIAKLNIKLRELS